MLQSIVTVILLVVDAVIVLTNPSAFGASLSLRIPGTANQTVSMTLQDLMVGVGAGLILAWVAALIDRGAVDRRVQHYERTMRVMSDEMLRVKARSYDAERQPLEDIRVKLDTLDRDVRGLRARIDREPLSADTNRVTIKNPSEAA